MALLRNTPCSVFVMDQAHLFQHWTHPRYSHSHLAGWPCSAQAFLLNHRTTEELPSAVASGRGFVVSSHFTLLYLGSARTQGLRIKVLDYYYDKCHMTLSDGQNLEVE